MSTRGPVAPPFSYALAVAAGLFGLPFMYVLTVHVAGIARLDYGEWALAPALGLALCYAALGVLFGLLWPGARWRWGVWLAAAPLCFISFLAPDPRLFLIWAATSLPPACAAAYVVARLRLKYP